MAEQHQTRFYASEQYYLPADKAETARLNLQHPVVVKAFENRLSLVPLNLKSDDRVLESGAGTGIWALEFFEENRKKGIMFDMECIDISDRQFPQNYPSSIHFSLHSVTGLPAEWSARFAYAHQRFLIAAMNDTLWRKAVSELFRVLVPGGWVELVEADANDTRNDVGPSSSKLQSILVNMHKEKGVVRNLGTYLPSLLEQAGFVDVQCEVRRSPIGQSEDAGLRGDVWAEFWKGLKRGVVNAGGYNIVKSGEEYEDLVNEATIEWNTSNKAYNTYCTILGKKP
ncbi:hypothetical protein GYMLUDRAFT_42873 [Collybiopsis luxurians FD-317 M1]|uniref:Methyltransferase domain-containing protein n=1 Tax=Collybiopsis luxurians FD-317 M1 TaxID=944289 RepID=A0A0D0CQH9_9AGAR|nr:hypothetical protein GYMLUDRAFT_42873 [Collybiopsis luxurians FD-317 M1]